jgi:prepilin-type N-terminal cleavage/methylation domain-containing protein
MKLPAKYNNINNQWHYRFGFTLIELLLVIAISTIVLSASLPMYSQFYLATQKNDAANQIVSSLRLAREYSMARYQDSSYGIYLYDASGQWKYVFYKGGSYALRDIDFDISRFVGKAIGLSTDLSGNEVSFSKGLGQPSSNGTIIIADNAGNEITIIISEDGIVREE